MAPTPLTLAETASVFGEMLTFRKLLRTPARRSARPCSPRKVEDMINTVVRQIAFYTFERKVHTERRTGELTADRLDALWLEVQHESLGPAIELKPGYESFWCLYPAFRAFAVLRLCLCVRGLPGELALRGLRAGRTKDLRERYLDMLAAGGTKHHSELLAPFGLDARDPAFWQGGLGVIERMIDELETLD